MSSRHGALRYSKISWSSGYGGMEVPTLIANDRGRDESLMDEEIPEQAVVFIAFHDYSWKQDLSTAAPGLMHGPLGALVPRVVLCSMTSIFTYQPKLNFFETASALVLLLKFPTSSGTADPISVRSLTLMHTDDSERSHYYVLGGEATRDIVLNRLSNVFEEARAGVRPGTSFEELILGADHDLITRILLVLGFCHMCMDWWLETLTWERFQTDKANSALDTVDSDVRVGRLLIYSAALSTNSAAVQQLLRANGMDKTEFLVDSLELLHEMSKQQAQAAQSLLELARHYSLSKSPGYAYSDLLRMQYLSQNYTKGAAIFAIVFLPGIFVSTFFALPFFEGLGDYDRVWIWFVLATPITLLSLFLLWVWFRLPVFKLRMKQRNLKREV